MAQTILIWDHDKVQIWRASRAGASLIQEGDAQDLTALLALLDKIEKSFQLDQDCQTKLHELGSDISMLNARDYPINVKPGQVDIYLTKL